MPHLGNEIFHVFFTDRVLDDRASPTAVAKTQFEILRRFNESQLYRAGAAGAAGGHPGAPGPGPPHPVASHIINSNLQSSSVTAEIMRMAVTVSEQDNGDPISGSGKSRYTLTSGSKHQLGGKGNFWPGNFSLKKSSKQTEFSQPYSKS